ncbi:PoNe immunity protein domain-containing protein [Streptococcus ruminantium]|uniref:PoNe immunity protein domain-containing protein n=1 Tax=Streptococcus ruminantium TaxID=1917441 RepID=UPI0012DD789A|nr:PoNe immunity protein domain-containing protein [Streptococcus ruminantium]
MKVRDHWNTLENYNKSILFYKSVVDEDLNDINELLEDERNGLQKHAISNQEVIENTRFFIANDFFKIFKSTYSAGYPISDVRKSFLNYLETKNLALDGHIHYLDDLDIISVGILLDIDAETMAPFIENIEQVNYQDYLMDFLIRYYRPDWPQHEEIRFKRPYAHAKAIIEAESQEKALGALRHYVFSKWYPGSNDAPWYNSHKSKNPAFHAGYWSFEAGAIAKILDLDDSSLEGQQYYPYDMVHWKG